MRRTRVGPRVYSLVHMFAIGLVHVVLSIFLLSLDISQPSRCCVALGARCECLYVDISRYNAALTAVECKETAGSLKR